MRIPHSIPESALRVYEPSAEAAQLRGGEEGRRVRAEDFGWNANVPPSLAYWCLVALARDFQDNPEALLELPQCDYDHLLEMLGTDLPLKLTVPLVPEGVFWRRCCEERWESNFVNEYGNSWKRMYLERHLQETLEKMAVEDYKDDEMVQLVQLVSPFVERLRVEEMQLIKSPQELEAVVDEAKAVLRQIMEDAEEVIHIEPAPPPPPKSKGKGGTAQSGGRRTPKDDKGRGGAKAGAAGAKGKDKGKGKGKGGKEEKEPPPPPPPRPPTPPTPDEPPPDEPDPCIPKHDIPLDHINLEPVLRNLANLKEFDLTYGVRDCGMDYRPELFKFSLQDVKNLGSGLQQAFALRVFRLTRSNMDDTLSPDLVRSLARVPLLRVLDLSHCRLGDRTACALGHLLALHSRLEMLDLTNNCIGERGVRGLAFGLQQLPCSPLRELRLRLNRVCDGGAAALASTLERSSVPRALGLAASGITSEGAMHLALALRRNTTLRHLDLSNNSLGDDGGDHLEKLMEMNQTLIELDLRMTDIPAFREYAILVAVENNKAKFRKLFSELKDHLLEGMQDAFEAARHEQSYAGYLSDVLTAQVQFALEQQKPNVRGLAASIYNDIIDVVVGHKDIDFFNVDDDKPPTRHEPLKSIFNVLFDIADDTKGSFVH